MNKSEFDKFAAEYGTILAGAIGPSGEDPAFFAEYKIRDVAQNLARHGVSPRTMLDFGCGVGSSVPHLRTHLAGTALTCVDVSQDSLDIAQVRFPGDAEYVLFDGVRLPFEDNTFDVIFTACVFHHIPAEEHLNMLAEIRRVLAPGGFFYIFEHNPLNPLTVRSVNQCPFDENAVLIRSGEMQKRLERAQFLSVTKTYRIFFPKFLKLLRRLEPFLEWCPLGAQYYLRGSK